MIRVRLNQSASHDHVYVYKARAAEEARDDLLLIGFVLVRIIVELFSFRSDLVPSAFPRRPVGLPSLAMDLDRLSSSSSSS
jgi:hypothetical protein